MGAGACGERVGRACAMLARRAPVHAWATCPARLAALQLLQQQLLLPVLLGSSRSVRGVRAGGGRSLYCPCTPPTLHAPHPLSRLAPRCMLCQRPRRFEKYGGLSASLRQILDAPPEVDMDGYQQRSRVQVRQLGLCGLCL